MASTLSFINQSDEKAESHGTLWLVIPCFNDATRLARFLTPLCAALEHVPVRVLVQVVDDGSSPADRNSLSELIRETQARFDFVRPVLYMERNEGKGAAILHGWEAAQEGADWLGFLDADGAVSADEVRRVLGLIESDSERGTAFFSSRIRMRGRTVDRSFKRHLTGRIFASLIGALIDPQIYDSQCGFKLIPKAAYQKMKPFLREKGFAFDVELLALLNHFKTPVLEVPVDWHDIPGSKVSLIRDSLRMLRAAVSIRARMQTGF